MIAIQDNVNGQPEFDTQEVYAVRSKKVRKATIELTPIVSVPSAPQTNEGGHSPIDTQCEGAPLTKKRRRPGPIDTQNCFATARISDDDHCSSGTQIAIVIASETTERGGQQNCNTQTFAAPSIRRLIELQAEMRTIVQDRIRHSNGMIAYIKLCLNSRHAPDDKERALVKKHAEALMEFMEGKAPSCPPEMVPVIHRVQRKFDIYRMSSDACAKVEKDLRKEMEKIADKLPAWEKLKGIRGFSSFALAKIVGESGDLSRFDGPDALKSRFGLAPWKGKACSTWRTSKPGLTAEEWEEVGYCPRRRAMMHVMGECLIKSADPHFRAKYDMAKAGFALKHPDTTPKHCHNHAMRVMQQELLRVVWRAWHGEANPIATKPEVIAA